MQTTKNSGKVQFTSKKSICPSSRFTNKVKSIRGGFIKLTNTSRRPINVATSQLLRIQIKLRGRQWPLLYRELFTSSKNILPFTFKGTSYPDSAQHRYYKNLPSKLASRDSRFRKMPKIIKTHIVEISEINKDMESTKSRVRLRENNATKLLVKESITFDELEAEQRAEFAKIKKEDSQGKIKKFVMGWKSGLSYRKTKKLKIVRDIPIAATSYCKTGISSCQLCWRRMACGAQEDILADLLHRESLQQFIEETEQFQASSSIVIKEDLKRQHLYDSLISYANILAKDNKDLSKQQRETDSANGNDLQLAIHLNLPPPVHIDYVPEKNLYEKDIIDEMIEFGILKGKPS